MYHIVMVQAHEVPQRWASPLSWAHGQVWVSRVPSPASLGHPKSHSLLRSCYSLQYLQGPGTGAYYPMNLKTFFSLLVLGDILKSPFFYGSLNVLSLSADFTFFPSFVHAPLEHKLWQNKNQENHCLVGEVGPQWHHAVSFLTALTTWFSTACALSSLWAQVPAPARLVSCCVRGTWCISWQVFNKYWLNS